ncbi:malate synthase G [Acinetobacter sp. HY1485]|uniref:malate synthase G n=1 Tax=Acinetobacter sp. HY1485 TaxID=2970918 RepID=UPI0022B98646|nr:malate synthase G [Acinetobacter sp. HY1485]
MSYIQQGRLHIDQVLYDFLQQDVFPITDINPAQYWKNFAKIVAELTPMNDALLQKREELQQKIDDWHQHNHFELQPYMAFLKEIGYVVNEPEDFSITTTNVDDEIAKIAGAQLVVPVLNARYSLNAANARWGSLYDALYGFDVISDADGAEKTATYNPVRGQKVIAFAVNFLDKYFTLENASYADIATYSTHQPIVRLKDQTERRIPKCIGYTNDGLILKNNDLHIILQLEQGQIKDVLIEAAITAIQDLEDSVAAVDGEDKVIGYQNWLGLMTGKLSVEFNKAKTKIERTLNDDIVYQTFDGKQKQLHGRSLMLLRNVGHLMTNPAILIDGKEIYEGIMDGLITPLLSKVDILGQNPKPNSRTGSMYIVKPKMHGPEEVAFTVQLFKASEQLNGLPSKSIKLGIMDEERRTSVNLKACIAQAKDRTIFINTGFMDRTGDEIHTSMQAGCVVRKNEIKQQVWFDAYEKRNVAIGLQCGLGGKAQIGKGMWAKPDLLLEMYQTKMEHPQAGASCAWVPSPSGAVIHALHYHQTYVGDVQKTIKAVPALSELLTPPLASHTDWTSEEIQQELDNNCQGVLGYVVRWVDLGIGCSKVPDIHGVGLMEDRATLRISSQHIANWLKYGVISVEQLDETLKRMQGIVEQQNQLKMSDIAFNAAKALIIDGDKQPSGYTEPVLHAARRTIKECITS